MKLQIKINVFLKPKTLTELIWYKSKYKRYQKNYKTNNRKYKKLIPINSKHIVVRMRYFLVSRIELSG